MPNGHGHFMSDDIHRHHCSPTSTPSFLVCHIISLDLRVQSDGKSSRLIEGVFHVPIALLRSTTANARIPRLGNTGNDPTPRAKSTYILKSFNTLDFQSDVYGQSRTNARNLSQSFNDLVAFQNIFKGRFNALDAFGINLIEIKRVL